MMPHSRNAQFLQVAEQLGYNFDGEMKIGGNYVPAVQNDLEIYVSGQIPRVDNTVMVTGRVGAQTTLEQARHGAQISTMRALAILRQMLEGDLGRIKKVLRLNVYVQSASDFTQQSEVADGASQVLYTVLGEAAVHSRTSVGVFQLPKNASVEVDVIVALSP